MSVKAESLLLSSQRKLELLVMPLGFSATQPMRKHGPACAQREQPTCVGKQRLLSLLRPELLSLCLLLLNTLQGQSMLGLMQ